MDNINQLFAIEKFENDNFFDLECLLEISKNRNYDGDRATTQIIFKYIGLILKIYNKYISFTSTTFDKDDLLSTVILGFIRAIQLYDPSKRVKFITYAYSSIQFEVWRAIENQSKSLRLPTLVYRNKYRLNKAIENLHLSLNRKPTLEELAEYCNLKISTVQNILATPKVTRSLDEPLDQNLEITLGEVIPDPMNQFSQLDFDIQRKDLIIFLKRVLSSTQYDILCMRYGIDSNYENGLNFSEISEHLRISREQVRQIHASAIKKLLLPDHSQYLYQLLI